MANRRRLRSLGAWLLLLAVVAALIVAQRPPVAGAQVAQLSPAERNEGALYYSQSCARCHGSDGAGRPGIAPALAGSVSAAYIDLVVRTGRMPPAGDPYEGLERRVVYAGQDREVLVAWMTQQFGLDPALPRADLGDPRRGQDVYNTNCAQCHGNSGQGGVAGGGAYTPNVAQYDPITIAEAIRVGPFEMPRFDMRQITDQDTNDVAAYLDEVRNSRGTPLGLVELNPVFASGFAFAFVMIVVASLFWIAGSPLPFANRRRDQSPGSFREAEGAPAPAPPDHTTPARPHHNQGAPAPAPPDHTTPARPRAQSE